MQFLNDQYVATVIHGDGGRPSILRQAGLGRADVVAGRPSGAFPGPEMVLEPGCQYVLAVQTSVTDEVVRLLRG